MARRRKQIIWERSPVLVWIPREPRDIRIAVVIGVVAWWFTLLAYLAAVLIRPGVTWLNITTVALVLLLGLVYALWPRKVVRPRRAKPATS